MTVTDVRTILLNSTLMIQQEEKGPQIPILERIPYHTKSLKNGGVIG